MNRLRLILKNLYLYFRYGFKKRDKQLILFGSWFGEKFADNSRFLFQYLAENKEKLGLKRVVWATRNEIVFSELKSLGYEVVMIGTKESDNVHKTAGVHIVCNAGSSTKEAKGDIDGKYSYGAIRINLWHGLPAKGVDYASLDYKKREKSHPFIMKVYYSLIKIKPIRAIGFQSGGWNDSYRLSTTSYITNLFMDMTKLPACKIIETGYPRNCSINKLLTEEKRVINDIKKTGYSILYLPTFRSSGINFMNPLDDPGIVSWLKDENVLWIQKPHSADKNMLSTRMQNASEVINLPDSFDINVLLPYVDVILTDYSSVCFDAIFHSKPIVFYVPDLEHYMNEDRGVVISPDEFMVGPKATNTGDLLSKLKAVKQNGMNEMSITYSDFRKKIWNCDTTMEDIWDAICKKTILQ